MIYLACPYWHDDPDVREERYKAATLVCARLNAEGIMTFSPLTHNHPMALVVDNIPESYWLAWDLKILESCDVLYVLKLPGWGESKGIAKEIDKATELGLLISYISADAYLSPEEIPCL